MITILRLTATKEDAWDPLAALEKSAAGGEFVLGGENVALWDFFGLLGRVLGKAAPRLKIPTPIGTVAGAMELVLARIMGRQSQMTPSSVRMMYQSWACDSSRARAELGYNYRSLECGLRETLVSMDIPIADCGLRIDGSQKDAASHVIRGRASTGVVSPVSIRNPNSEIRNERKDDCCRTGCK